MKNIFTGFNLIGVIALLALAVSCTTTERGTQNKEKSYYVFPDAANNQAYVGGPTQYQAYRQIRTAIQFRNESLEAAGLEQESDWGTWSGMGRTEIAAT
jgi:hypothetical protein